MLKKSKTSKRTVMVPDAPFARRVFNPNAKNFEAQLTEVEFLFEDMGIEGFDFDLGYGLRGQIEMMLGEGAALYSLDEQGRFNGAMNIDQEDLDTLDYENFESYASAEVRIWIEDNRAAIWMDCGEPQRIGWEIVSGATHFKQKMGYFPDVPSLKHHPKTHKKMRCRHTISKAQAQTIRAMINAGDTDGVIKLLDEQPALIHARLEYGATLLHDAARLSNVALVAELLKRGAEVDAQMRGGFQAIHLAAEGVELMTNEPIEETVALLLAAGASVFCRTADGMTPLLYACLACRSVLGLLLDSGSNPWARSGDGRSGEDWLDIS